MSDTIAVSASMTAREMFDAVVALKKIAGPKADVYVSTAYTSYETKDFAYLSIHTDGMCGKPENHRSFFGKDWPDVFAAAQEWLATHGPVQRNAMIRSMALAIIELTDEHGRCTEAMLRCRGFTAEEIAEFRDAACVRAGEMAGNVPFEVVP